MVTGLSDLQCHLLQAEYPRPADRGIYAASYELWRSVWTTTFQELDGDPTCHSDNFCRQTRIIVITAKGVPAALVTHHDLDFSLPTAQADSYFKIWSKDAIARLTKDGPRISVVGGLVVHPEYRGPMAAGLKLKDLIVGLSTRVLIESDGDAQMGIARCSKGVHRTTHRTGAEVIETGRKLHNEEVELVVWYRRALIAGGYAPDLAVERLWKSRIDHDREVAALAAPWKKAA